MDAADAAGDLAHEYGMVLVSSKVLEFKRRRRRRTRTRTRKWRGAGNSPVFAPLFVLQSLVIIQLTAAIVQFAHSIPIVGQEESAAPLGRRQLPHLSTTSTTTTATAATAWYEGATSVQYSRQVRRSRELPEVASSNSTPPPAAGLTRQQQEAAYSQRLAELRQKFVNNRAINDTAYYVLLLVYSLLIAIGTVSNLLICLTVSSSPLIVDISQE